MNIYFFIICAWYMLALGVHLAEHGKPIENKYNFFRTLTMTVILIGLIIGAMNY